jgi:hypothetical protein
MEVGAPTNTNGKRKLERDNGAKNTKHFMMLLHVHSRPLDSCARVGLVDDMPLCLQEQIHACLEKRVHDTGGLCIFDEVEAAQSGPQTVFMNLDNRDKAFKIQQGDSAHFFNVSHLLTEDELERVRNWELDFACVWTGDIHIAFQLYASQMR